MTRLNIKKSPCSYCQKDDTNCAGCISQRRWAFLAWATLRKHYLGVPLPTAGEVQAAERKKLGEKEK